MTLLWRLCAIRNASLICMQSNSGLNEAPAWHFHYLELLEIVAKPNRRHCCCYRFARFVLEQASDYLQAENPPMKLAGN
jgi:hypothetical protein